MKQKQIPNYMPETAQEKQNENIYSLENLQEKLQKLDFSLFSENTQKSLENLKEKITTLSKDESPIQESIHEMVDSLSEKQNSIKLDQETIQKILSS